MSTLPGGGIWDGIDMGQAVDESLPPGVIAGQDGDGCWWRYPLAEFSESDGGSTDG